MNYTDEQKNNIIEKYNKIKEQQKKASREYIKRIKDSGRPLLWEGKPSNKPLDSLE